MSDLDGIPARIRAILEARGWTPYRLAAIAQIDSNVISNWLRRGVRRPDPMVMRNIAAAAKVPYLWLLNGEGAMDGPREEPTAPSHSESSIPVFGNALGYADAMAVVEKDDPPWPAWALERSRNVAQWVTAGPVTPDDLRKIVALVMELNPVVKAEAELVAAKEAIARKEAALEKLKRDREGTKGEGTR